MTTTLPFGAAVAGCAATVMPRPTEAAVSRESTPRATLLLRRRAVRRCAPVARCVFTKHVLSKSVRWDAASTRQSKG